MLAILLSHKITVRQEALVEIKKGYFIIIKVNLQKIYHNLKSVCPQQHSFIVYIAKVERTSRNK